MVRRRSVIGSARDLPRAVRLLAERELAAPREAIGRIRELDEPALAAGALEGLLRRRGPGMAPLRQELDALPVHARHRAAGEEAEVLRERGGRERARGNDQHEPGEVHGVLDLKGAARSIPARFGPSSRALALAPPLAEQVGRYCAATIARNE